MRPTEIKDITLNDELELILWDNKLVSVLTPDFEATAGLDELVEVVGSFVVEMANYEFAQAAAEVEEGT
jgi:hypothetical protein